MRNQVRNYGKPKNLSCPPPPMKERLEKNHTESAWRCIGFLLETVEVGKSWCYYIVHYQNFADVKTSNSWVLICLTNLIFKLLQIIVCEETRIGLTQNPKSIVGDRNAGKYRVETFGSNNWKSSYIVDCNNTLPLFTISSTYIRPVSFGNEISITY